MLGRVKRDITFVAKHITSLIGALFLAFAGAPVNKEGYEKRVLVVFGGGIGDVAIQSIVCGYIKEYLKDREVFYLIPYKFQLPYAKECISYDYKKIKRNPLYYFRFVNQLRRIGFSDAIVLFQFWDGFLPSLAADVAPQRAFYSKEKARNRFYIAVSRINYALRYFTFRKRATFVKVASEWDADAALKGWADAWLPGIFPNLAIKEAYFISQVIKIMEPHAPALLPNGLLPLAAPRTELAVDAELEKNYLASLAARGVAIERTCLIGLGSSHPRKNWPVARFVEAAKMLSGMGFQIGVIDHPKDAALVAEFARLYHGDFFNFADANLPKVFILIKHARLVLANDTSFIHIAVALRTPSVCVKIKEPQAYSFYGYKEINKWVETDAMYAPVSSIPTAPVEEACKAALARGRTAEHAERFRFHF
jgi:ADP-heptose:LPS heptosyltransferase